MADNKNDIKGKIEDLIIKGIPDLSDDRSSGNPFNKGERIWDYPNANENRDYGHSGLPPKPPIMQTNDNTDDEK